MRAKVIEGSYYTLIPSRFPPLPLFARIANDRDADVAGVESLTNPRLRERTRLLGGVQAIDDNSPQLQNWNHAPFTYPNPEGSRYFGPDQQVLEIAADLQTAVAISVRKREVFLGRTAENEIGLDMRVLVRRVCGRFADHLDLDPELGHAERMLIGQAVLNADLDGLLFRPPERPSGTCLAVLSGGTLDRAVQADHFRFIWDGKRISSIYAFSSGHKIDPGKLSLPDIILAA